MNERQKSLHYEKYIILRQYIALCKQASSTICAEEPIFDLHGMVDSFTIDRNGQQKLHFLVEYLPEVAVHLHIAVPFGAYF